MKRKKGRRFFTGMLAAGLLLTLLTGCKQEQTQIGKDEETLRDNIIITETGEVIEKDEKNRQMEEENQPKPSPDITPTANPTVEVAEELDISYTEPEQVVTEEDQTEPTGSDLQLIFLGDSIFDTSRDGTGIPYLTAVACNNADVFNLAIGGTCAALKKDESKDIDTWSSWNLPVLVNAMMGNVPAEHFNGVRTGEILANTEIDYSKTDYFIVEYGTNDFLSGMQKDCDEDDYFDLNSYAGALRYAVANLSNLSPDATIILCSPCYAQFYNGTWMIGDGNVTNNGYGTLFDYVGTCNYIAKEHHTLFLNAYEDLGINSYTAEEYLEDGIHLTEAGRALYAETLANMIMKNEETKNN